MALDSHDTRPSTGAEGASGVMTKISTAGLDRGAGKIKDIPVSGQVRPRARGRTTALDMPGSKAGQQNRNSHDASREWEVTMLE
ncbi:hypothetical protein VTK26DRAFT_4016 [Humicola hyalothermophila]